MHMGMSRRRVLATSLLGVSLLLPVAGCSPDALLGTNTLPPDVPDPEHLETPDGALGRYRGAVALFGWAFGGRNGFAEQTAVLTDELGSGSVGLVGLSGSLTNVDARTLPEGTTLDTDEAYEALQKTRGQITDALGALRAYAPDGTEGLRGQLYAFDGYVEIFLADLFCSGVPLSTVDFDGDFTYAPGSTTAEVYRRAVAHFDSAIALATDSADVVNLARVGKARALLAIGDYDAAQLAATDVPDEFRYRISYSAYQNGASDGKVGSEGNFGARIVGLRGFTMVDQEGGRGLAYISSHDPRTPSVALGNNRYGVPMYRPAMYSVSGDSPIVVASGLEAQLVRAEAQLHAGDTTAWLATLNALRTDGAFDTQRDPVDTTQTDTLWHAGSGGVAGLRPLDDPAAPSGRIDLLFQERGYWLFLTGHRQGDLRRFVRLYGRDPRTVYPTGAYAAASGRFGDDIDAPIPVAERTYNPQFHGCFRRGD